jgi:hypothetical protein
VVTEIKDLEVASHGLVSILHFTLEFRVGRYTSVVLLVFWDSANPTGNGLISWVDHMELNYDMILLLRHILYLYYIYDDIIQ